MKKRIALACWLASTLACADAKLHVFVFNDGKTFENITVAIGDSNQSTNRYGKTVFALEPGEYEVGFFKGAHQISLTEMVMVDNQDSQIFLNFVPRAEGAQIDFDLPVRAYEDSFETSDIKKDDGPKGMLRGQVLSKEDNKTVTEAKIYFRGYEAEAVTDEKGHFEVEIAADSHAISIVHPSYVMKSLKDVQVVQDQNTTLLIQMIPARIELEEFIVTAPHVEGSLASMITQMKESESIANIIGSEQFSKQGDSDAAGALKRVTGLTLMGGKYIYVRGLGERYSNVMLNDLFIPSPEPTKRVIPLDIFPTGVIESMKIQKTYSADLPGNFGGGSVNIKTKDIPKQDNYIQISMSVDYKDGSTLQDAIYSNGNGAELLDSSVLAESLKNSNLETFSDATSYLYLPGDYSQGQLLIESMDVFEEEYENYLAQQNETEEEFLQNCSELQNSDIDAYNANCTGKILPSEKTEIVNYLKNYRDYGIRNKKLQPGYKLAASTAQGFKTASGLGYGFTASAYYGNEGDSSVKTKYNYAKDQRTGELTPTDYSLKYGMDRNSTDQTLTTLSEKYGGLVSFLVDNQEGHSLKYTMLYLKDIEDNTLNYPRISTSTETLEDTYNLSYFDRELFMNQVNGKHEVGFEDSLIDSLQLDWSAEKASASRYEPGTVNYVYEKPIGTDNDGEYYPWILGGEQDMATINYTTSQLDDEVDNYKAKILFQKDNVGITVGFEKMTKNRSFDTETFKLTLNSYIENSFPNEEDNYDVMDDKIDQIDETGFPTEAEYSTQTEYDSQGNLVGSTEVLDGYYIGGPVKEEETGNTVSNEYSDQLVSPQSNDSYKAEETINAKFIQAKFSPLERLEIISGFRKEESEQKTTPLDSDRSPSLSTADLVLPAHAISYGITDDLYVRAAYSESVSRPDFREFADSKYLDPSTGYTYVGNPDITYTEITNYDLKFDYYLSYDEVFSLALFKKKFLNPIELTIAEDNFSTRSYANAESGTSQGWEVDFRKNFGFFGPEYRNFFIAGNYAAIESEIQLNLDDPAQKNLTSTSRAMQGQSPYVVNLQIGYNNLNTKTSAILMFNEFGERIVGVGTKGSSANVEENAGVPDEYEMPFRQLDFVYKMRLNDNYDDQVKKGTFSLTFKAKNLLNDEAIIMQGGEVTQKYKKGRSYSLSLSYKY